MAGRETYDRETLVPLICQRLAKGEFLTVICRTPGMPEPRTVRDWDAEDEKIAAAIACAREQGEQARAETLSAIARGGEGSTGDVQRDKLIVDTELRLLAKFNPKRWGDRQAVEHSGGLTLEQLVTGKK